MLVDVYEGVIEGVGVGGGVKSVQRTDTTLVDEFEYQTLKSVGTYIDDIVEPVVVVIFCLLNICVFVEQLTTKISLP